MFVSDSIDGDIFCIVKVLKVKFDCFMNKCIGHCLSHSLKLNKYYPILQTNTILKINESRVFVPVPRKQAESSSLIIVLCILTELV